MQTWLYHIDCLKGRLFRTGDEVEKALAEGWVDAPGKCELPAEPAYRASGYTPKRVSEFAVSADSKSAKPAKRKAK